MMEFQVLAAASCSLADRTLLDGFVRSAPTGTYYHSLDWLQPVALAMGQDIRIHTLMDRDTVAAVAVVRSTRRFGLSLARKPWATFYNGIVTNTADPTAESATLRAELLRRYHTVRLVQPPDHASSSSVPPAPPWRVSASYTPYLDITDVGRLWDSFDRHARQRVRKAMSHGVVVSETTDYDAFHGLYVKTYERQGLSMPLPRHQLTEVLSLAVRAGATRCYMAMTSGGAPAAFLVVGFDTRRAYFVLAASDPEHRKTDAVTLLWWHAMQACAETHTEIDLVGVGTPEIGRFKDSFCPTRTPYAAWSAYSSSPGGFAVRLLDRVPGLTARLRNAMSREGGHSRGSP